MELKSHSTKLVSILIMFIFWFNQFQVEAHQALLQKSEKRQHGKCFTNFQTSEKFYEDDIFGQKVTTSTPSDFIQIKKLSKNISKTNEDHQSTSECSFHQINNSLSFNFSQENLPVFSILPQNVDIPPYERSVSAEARTEAKWGGWLIYMNNFTSEGTI